MIERDSQTPLYEQIAAELRRQIITGQVQPGGKLPSESEVMAEHGVARLTARKAFRVLASEGLVTIVQGRGAFASRGVA